jgi:GH15 family glucan-1,4-alpha-glucosidase
MARLDGRAIAASRTPAPYLPLEQHGVIGNGRTAALIAADGTIDWFCAPDFDATVVFGALLDVRRGGFWRVAPGMRRRGTQSYDEGDWLLSTRWSDASCELVVTDALMPGPVMIRRVECRRGEAACSSLMQLAADFSPVEGSEEERPPFPLHIWSSHPQLASASGEARLRAGERVWLTLSPRAAAVADAHTCERMFARARDEARQRRPARAQGCAPLARSAAVLQLLQYQPTGAMVAAPTTSIPERIGGTWNVDYRLSWVRDTSLAMTALARLGDCAPAERYLRWLAPLGSHDGKAPLQTLYDIHGGMEPVRRERYDLAGYRRSTPVRFGNHAFRQRQLDIFGYLADCALAVIDAGGVCPPEVWRLLERCAHFIACQWRQPDHSLWELPATRHYTSSRVMCWVALDRIGRIGERLDRAVDGRWRDTAAAIRREVLDAGWNRSLGAFTQTLGGDTLDASALLIPIYGLLPASDPRVAATVDRLCEELTIDGLLYRFDPLTMPELDDLPLGEFEAAFVPCTLWLAYVCRQLGRARDAAALVDALHAIAGPTGLLGEAVDPRTRTFAGNFPLGFSHAEYVRYALAD